MERLIGEAIERPGLEEDAERVRLERRKEKNRKTRERRKRNKQLQKQQSNEFQSQEIPPPPRTPLPDTAPILDQHIDFEALLAVHPDDPARNEYIEQRAGVLSLGFSGDHLVEFMDPKKDFYLVPCILLPGEPKYYKRLVVNNMGTRKGGYDATWSRDLLSDQQYVHFYSKLENSLTIKDLIPSWYDFVNCCFDKAIRNDLTQKRLVYEPEVFRIAEETEFSNLKRSDIYNCIMDLIQEKSLIKDRLRYSRKFHLHLLECGYGEEDGEEDGEEEEISNKYLNWGIKEPHPIDERYEMQWFTEWLDQPEIREMNKEEKKTELMRYHEKKSKEDSSTRIRYLRLKLELAKSLGLIPEEADTN